MTPKEANGWCNAGRTSPRSPLEQRLKERGIKSVIVTGTSAQGVGIGTGSGAAQRGYDVIVPSTGSRPTMPSWSSMRPITWPRAGQRS